MTESSNGSEKLRAILVFVSTIATIAFNGLAATGYINGVMADEVSDRYPTVLTPAGFTFSIWAAIYLGILGFSVYQMLPSKLVTFRPIRTLYIASCAMNCAWLWSWNRYQMSACVAIILGLLGILLMITMKFKHADSFTDALFGKGVFGLYFGWVTAAALVNILIFLLYSGVNMPAPAWKIVGAASLLIAAGLAVAVRFKLRNFTYPLALAWAATGIAVKQSGNTVIVVAAAVCVIICLVLAVSFVMDQRSQMT